MFRRGVTLENGASSARSDAGVGTIVSGKWNVGVFTGTPGRTPTDGDPDSDVVGVGSTREPASGGAAGEPAAAGGGVTNAGGAAAAG